MTLREHTTLSKKKEKKREEKNTTEGRDCTRRNLTQDKQLTKHAQKLITAFMEHMSMIGWVCVSWRRDQDCDFKLIQQPNMSIE